MNDIKNFEPLWGSWYIKDLLGEGGYGRVYRIERKEFNNTYVAALKHIRVPQSQSEVRSIMADGMSEKSVEQYFEVFVEEIVKEFALMSKLKGDSHIVSYEDHKVVKAEDKIQWDLFIRMELLTSLFDYAAKNSITKRDVIQLGIDICKALEICQKYNIIHRDIKPENIFVSDTGKFKLGDFGIARQVEKTVSGLSKKGTFTYIAPEVYKGDAYGSTVDIYSLGIVMYRLLNSNRVPFMPPYPQTISHKDREIALLKRMSGQKFDKPVNADGRLAEIVLKACSYDSKDRYENPTLMRKALESIMYSKEEAAFIYPEGDEAEIKSVKYVSEEPDNIFKTHTMVGDFDSFIKNKGVSDIKSDKNDKKETVVSENKAEKEEIKAVNFSEIETEAAVKSAKSNKKILLIIPAVVVAIVLAVAFSRGYNKYQAQKEQERIAVEIVEENKKAEEAYKEIENSTEYFPYCLYDIDKDGIVELITGQNGRTGGVVDIYAYRNAVQNTLVNSSVNQNTGSYGNTANKQPTGNTYKNNTANKPATQKSAAQQAPAQTAPAQSAPAASETPDFFVSLD